MKTYPHAEDGQIIELVRKDEYYAVASELAKWQALAGTLAKSIGGLSPIYGTTPAQDAALAAYESAKSGNLPDPLAEAVKRMESVDLMPSVREFTTLGKTIGSAMQNLHARLIQAAKGEQP